MRAALLAAEDGLAHGELPIGAVVVCQGEVVARAWTQERAQRRLLVHAELLALDAADRLDPLPGRRREMALFTTTEPCMMCMGAAMSFFIGHVFYALEAPGDGAVGLVQQWSRVTEDFPQYRTPTLHGGVLRAEARDLFSRYVRGAAPGPMRDWAEKQATLP